MRRIVELWLHAISRQTIPFPVASKVEVINRLARIPVVKVMKETGIEYIPMISTDRPRTRIEKGVYNTMKKIIRD